MKRFTVIMCFVLVSLFSLRAHADLDPSIGIGDPNCSSFHDFPVQNVTGGFTFTANNNGGGVFAFCNITAGIWTTVDIRFIEPAPPSSPGFIDPNTITCNNLGNNPPFTSCVPTLLAGNILDILFSNPQEDSEGSSGGIPVNGIMIVTLNDGSCLPSNQTTCNDNTGGWPAGLQFFGA